MNILLLDLSLVKIVSLHKSTSLACGLLSKHVVILPVLTPAMKSPWLGDGVIRHDSKLNLSNLGDLLARSSQEFPEDNRSQLKTCWWLAGSDCMSAAAVLAPVMLSTCVSIEPGQQWRRCVIEEVVSPHFDLPTWPQNWGYKPCILVPSCGHWPGRSGSAWFPKF